MDSYFIVNSNLSGLYPQTGFVSSMTVGTVIPCAMACLCCVICSSLFYNNITRECLLIKTTYEANAGLLWALSWEYYGKTVLEYVVYVRTDERKGAGTDARVFLKIYGSKATTGELELFEDMAGPEKFALGAIDVFKFNIADVGAIEKIKIGHDNIRGQNYAEWRLSWVKISVAGRPDVVVNINTWLQKSKKLYVTVKPT